MTPYRVGCARVAMAALLFASAMRIAVAAEANAWKHAADDASASAGASAAPLLAVDHDTGAVRLPLGRLEAALAPDARLQLFTVTDRPGLYVMQAASLAQQGAMFARVGALL